MILPWDVRWHGLQAVSIAVPTLKLTIKAYGPLLEN